MQYMTDHQWSLDILKNRLSYIICLIIHVVVCIGCGTTTSIPVATEVDDDLRLQVDGKILEVDELGFIYVVDRTNRIRRYDDQYRLTYEYSNDRLGSIKILDVSNPLKILVFYPNYQMVVALDNTLAETIRYDLSALQYNDVTAVGISDDNFIWLYDPIQFRLIKINDGGKILLESNSLLSENIEGLRPERIVEKLNKVYLMDEEYGGVLFDNYAKYSKRIDLANFEKAKVLVDGSIIYLRETGLHQKMIGISQDEKRIFKTDEVIRDFALKNQQILIMTNYGIKDGL